MKKAVLISALLVVMSLASCNATDVPEVEHKTEKENLVKYKAYSDGSATYNYIVDTKYGVVYLEADDYRSHALTIMLDDDGKPLKAEKLGLEY